MRREEVRRKKTNRRSQAPQPFLFLQTQSSSMPRGALKDDRFPFLDLLHRQPRETGDGQLVDRGGEVRWVIDDGLAEVG